MAKDLYTIILYKSLVWPKSPLTAPVGSLFICKFRILWELTGKLPQVSGITLKEPFILLLCYI